jgi:hypothetical protein
VALALAGADATAPPFGETAVLVARAAGWDYARLMDADAAEVDRLARQLGGRPLRSGWTRFVLAGDAAGELDAMRRELAQTLLERSDELPIDLEDAVGVAAAPTGSPGGDDDFWRFPARASEPDGAAVEWPSAPSADHAPPERRRRDTEVPSAARGGAAAEGQTPTVSRADRSERATSRVRPGTGPEPTRPSAARPGSEPRLPAFRFDGSGVAEPPSQGERRSGDLFSQVPMRTGPHLSTASESGVSRSGAPSVADVAATAGGAARSFDDSSARAWGRWSAPTAGSVEPSPSGGAPGPVDLAPSAWGAPDPAIALVPPRAQPFVHAPGASRQWPDAAALDVAPTRTRDLAPRPAHDVAELLAAALDEECDLRGLAR